MQELTDYEVRPSPPIQGTARPPGSKSITNRALVCAALAKGESRLCGALNSEDTRVMVDALRSLGISIDSDWDQGQIEVRGCGGVIPARQADLFVGNSGTTVRFLTAIVGLGNGTYRLDGVPRMRERPIGDLLDAMRQMGVQARAEFDNQCPPVSIESHGLAGGTIRVRGSISSQFLSGLLLAAPYAKTNVQLLVEGELVSQPYVDMTCRVMEAFGARVSRPGTAEFWIDRQAPYQGRNYAIEPDASAASYFWGAAAVTQGSVLVEGLDPHALQGDIGFVDCLVRMGCDVEYDAQGIRVTGRPLRGIAVDMNRISDTVQTLAAVSLFAQGVTTITGVAHIRHKETDRIGDLATELRRLGATVVEFTDGLQITPPVQIQPARLQTYQDHRMAMSLALVGLRVPGIRIADPGCTAKTYPDYFSDLEKLCRTSEHIA